MTSKTITTKLNKRILFHIMTYKTFIIESNKILLFHIMPYKTFIIEIKFFCFHIMTYT